MRSPTQPGDENHTLYVGLNYFLKGHNLKFMTGVEPGNAPSEAVCAKMGLVDSDAAIIGCADPNSLASGRMTK